ncbi:MAG: hypothetical protein JO150_17790 [Acidobacteriaceae bacterium]|nr:hypothetical protein [Acidobacteriaceae bacterium]
MPVHYKAGGEISGLRACIQVNLVHQAAFQFAIERIHADVSHGPSPQLVRDRCRTIR